MHLLVDSTGIKLEGQAEWKARKRGGTKQRVWWKLRIGIDAKTLDIRAAEVATSDIGDAPMLSERPDRIPPDQEIAAVTAFDTRKGHDAIAARCAAEIIPPRRNARPWKPDTAGAPGHCPRTKGGQCLDPQRNPADIEARRSNHLPTMERASQTKSRRGQDALCGIARPSPERMRPRPSGDLRNWVQIIRSVHSLTDAILLGLSHQSMVVPQALHQVGHCRHLMRLHPVPRGGAYCAGPCVLPGLIRAQVRPAGSTKAAAAFLAAGLAASCGNRKPAIA